MPNYLVESYLADTCDAVNLARERARSVAAEGTSIRYVRTTFIPGDETILHLFEAPSLAALRRAARRSALPCDRIVEAVEDSGERASTRQAIHNHEGDSR
jgi:Nickel responsive protein SCO4226-like